MQKYSREIVAEVLAANDIIEVIGSVLDLSPAGGGRMKALCPFHHEKTPSFIVSRDRQSFHCFGCGKGGDAVGFLMAQEGLSFSEALLKLADRAGIRLPAFGGGDGEDFLRTHLLELGVFAAKHYRQELNEPLRGSHARQYLKSRGIGQDTLRRFGVGYASQEWDALLRAAREKGYASAVLDACGLFKRGERGGTYDFFRNRVMFPVKDVSGQIVAFGGRALDDSPAKYINSPETAVYKKSRVLYGLHEAREGLRREGFALLVEGYFDLLRCFDNGIENVVASCGTALTPEQAALLRRYVKEVVLVYDGDAAGVKAALKGTGILTAAGLGVRALALPDQLDPDDFIKAQGADAFRALVSAAPDFITFYVSMNTGRIVTIEGRTEVAEEIFGILTGIEDGLRVDEYLKQAARALGLHEWACRTEFARFVRKSAVRRPAPVREKPPEVAPIKEEDCIFLAALLQNAALLQHVQQRLGGAAMPDEPLVDVLHCLFAGRNAALVQDLGSDEAVRLYTAAANRPEDCGPNAQDLVRKRVIRLEQDGLRARSEEIRRALEAAVRDRDDKRVAMLLRENIETKQKLERAGAA